MEFDFEAIAQLAPAAARALLPGWLGSYIVGDRSSAIASAAGALAGVDDAALAEALAAFGTWGAAYGPHPAKPAARRLARAYMAPIVAGSEVVGLEHARAAMGDPAPLWIGNHLSYIDTQVTDCLLHLAGADDLADGLIVVAGPKVYSDPFRRIASMGLNTLKTAQSSTLSTNAEALSPRQVAAIAIQNIRDCVAWRAARGPTLLYPEGTRSRTGQLGPFLRAAARYTRGARLILPLTVQGTADLFGMDERMRPTPCRLTFGPAFSPADYPGKTGPLDEARRRVEALLA